MIVSGEHPGSPAGVIAAVVNAFDADPIAKSVCWSAVVASRSALGVYLTVTYRSSRPTSLSGTYLPISRRNCSIDL